MSIPAICAGSRWFILSSARSAPISSGRPLAAVDVPPAARRGAFPLSLVRVAENVEGIALYRGEEQEKVNLLHRFMAVIGNFYAIMHRTMLLNMVTVGYSQIAVSFRLVAAAPRYFAGKVTVGCVVSGGFGVWQRRGCAVMDRRSL